MPKSVKEIITENIEQVENQYKVLAWVEAYGNGKLLGEPVLKKMKAATGIESLRIVRNYGMTNLEWGDYGYTKNTGVPGVSLLLAHQTTNVYLDAVAMREKNPAYFDAALKRNEVRKVALADEKVMKDLEDTMAQFIAARDKLAKLFEYGTIFNHDSCSIEKEYGINQRR